MKQNNKKFNNAMHKFVGVLDKYAKLGFRSNQLLMSPIQQLCLMHKVNPWPVAGGILPIVGYTGRLRPKGVPFLSLQYTKGQGKLQLLFYYMKGSQDQLQSGRNGGKSKVHQRLPNFGGNDNAKYISACTLRATELE